MRRVDERSLLFDICAPRTLHNDLPLFGRGALDEVALEEDAL